MSSRNISPQRRTFMDKDSTTFGLKPDKLVQLWNIGEKTDRTNTEENQDQLKSELLRDRLAQKIPLDYLVAQILPKALAQICKNIQPFTGNSYNILLCDPLTEITILKKIKEDNKKIIQHMNSGSEYDVLVAVYYAAIASALVYHDQRITSFSYSHLKDKYISLLENNWLTQDLRNLYQQALYFCSKK